MSAGRRPPAPWRAIVTAARTDLGRLLRDPVALFFIVVLPVVIMLVIGATFGAQPAHTPLGLVDLDRSVASARLVAAVRDSGVVDVRDYTDEDAMARDVRLQNVAGGLAIPAGYGAALDRGDTGVVTLSLDQKRGSGSTLNDLLGNILAREGQVAAAARFAADHVGGDPAALAERARAAQARVQAVDVDVETTGRASLGTDNRYAYTAPSNLVLFVFINSVTGATALVESRRLGVTRRMLSTPMTVGEIAAGATVARLAIALLQSALILGVGGLVFGVQWGDPLGVAALVLTFALLSTGAGLLVAARADNPEQVPALGIPVAIGLAMIGGCLWPLEVVPPALRAVGHLAPHAWAMDAWIVLGFEGGGIGAIARELAVLGAVAAVLLVLGVRQLNRSLTG